MRRHIQKLKVTQPPPATDKGRRAIRIAQVRPKAQKKKPSTRQSQSFAEFSDAAREFLEEGDYNDS